MHEACIKFYILLTYNIFINYFGRMEITLLIILIALNGVFALSEMALVSARKARLAVFAAEGDRRALAAMRLGEDPARFLSAIQIGITSIGLLSGIVGEAALAGPLGIWLARTFELSSSAAGTVATVLVVTAVTYLSIVIGELVPKRLGQLAPEKTACLVARPMTALAMLSRPFVSLLSVSTRCLLRILGVRDSDEQAVTEEEIQAMIDESSQSGAIEQKQKEMLKNIFLLDDRQSSSIMVPRADIRFLDVTRSPEENLAVLRECEHSWLPVCRGGLNDLFGIIRNRQALLAFTGSMPSQEEFARNLEENCQSPVFVPETLSSLALLKLFQEKGMHIAFIIDEYGTLQGIVTPHDLLEILAGQMNVPHDEAWSVQRADGSWLMDGSIPIPELKTLLGIRRLPDENEGLYSILSGMLMYLAGRIPATGDVMECAGWRFEIVDMDGNMIDKVLVSLPVNEEA